MTENPKSEDETPLVPHGLLDVDETPEVDSDDDSISKFRRPRKNSASLAVALLRTAIGRQIDRVVNDPGFCLVLLLKSSDWIAPMANAVNGIASWRTVYQGGASVRQKETLEAEAMEKLSKGGRLVCVGTKSGNITPRMMAAADLVIEIDRLDVTAVRRTIKAVTGQSARGLTAIDLEGMGLIEAMAAIRPESTAAQCVRRLKASGSGKALDPFVASAPLLSELAGYGAAGEWAERLVADLTRWRAGEIPFSDLEHNAVLAGHPGTGKSTFVRSIARTAGIPLFASSVGQLFATTAGYLDSVVKGIDDLFSEARAAGETAIVFLDEVDGVPDRANLDGRHSSWWTPVVNHLLTTLDSALSERSSNLIVIGATNHPHKLDAALTRPGRLDRIMWINLPIAADLEKIFRHHLAGDLAGQDLRPIAELALGSTGADVVGHIKSARSYARSNGIAMEMKHLIAAVCPPSPMSAEDIRRVAIHEAGHAVAAVVLGGDPVRGVMISGNATGGRVTYERTAPFLGSAELNRREVVQLLAGRAAEECLLGSVSSGAGGSSTSDLAKATRIVSASRLSWGLGGLLTYVTEPDDASVHARRSLTMVNAVEADLQTFYREALDIIEANHQVVTVLAERLVERRAISGDEVRELVASVSPTGKGKADVSGN